MSAFSCECPENEENVSGMQASAKACMSSSLVPEHCSTGSLTVGFTGWLELFAQDTKQSPVSWAVLGNLCWAKCSARTFPLMFHLSLHRILCWKTHWVKSVMGTGVCVEAEATTTFFVFPGVFLVPYSCLGSSCILWSCMNIDVGETKKVSFIR